jgi:uncharacterized protein YjbI with pentapeptide repeats
MGKIGCVFIVVGASLVTGMAAGSAAAAEDTQATLRFINPEIFLKGIRIKHIVATLDGQDFGGCWYDQREPGNVCIKPQAISAGPHVLEVLLDPLLSTYFTWVDKFNADVSGAWTLDLQGITVDGEKKTGDYFTVAQGSAPVGECHAALAHLAALPSCTLDQFEALAPAFAKTLKVCARGIPRAERAAAASAFSAAVDNHFDLDVARCYTRAEIKELPARLLSFGQPDDYWPLEKGSWRWARGRERALSATNIAGALRKLQDRLPEMAKRFAVVDGAIKAYLSGDGTAMRQAAMSAPFSLDAETPEGQRNWLLLGDPGNFYSDDYADFVADKVAADAELDCARSDLETDTLVDFFIAKGKLSAPAYNALVALAKRVPSDLGFGACGKAIDLSLDSAVAPADRLRPFFALDCAATRVPEVRGDAVASFLSNDARDDNAIQRQMRQEFAGCLAEHRHLAGAAVTSRVLADAAKHGCRIEPDATCTEVSLRQADLHGVDLHGAKLGQADFEEADLTDANLAGADLHQAILDRAALSGADLAGANLAQVYARKTDFHGVRLVGIGTMRGANLRDSDLHGANLSGVVLSEALLDGANFEGANLAGGDFSAAKLTKAHFQNSDLRGAKFDGADLTEGDFRGANVAGASLRDAKLRRVNLAGALLANVDLADTPLEDVTWVNGCKLEAGGQCPGVDLHGLSLQRADLHGIDLSGANLAGADLSFAWLEGADLHGADLRGANVQGTILRGANLAGADLEGSQGGGPQLDGANMSETILSDGKKCALGAKADRYHDC